jgi:hypothetical protein
LQVAEKALCAGVVKGHGFSRAVNASQSTIGFSRWGMFFTASGSKLLFSASCLARPKRRTPRRIGYVRASARTYPRAPRLNHFSLNLQREIFGGYFSFSSHS